MMAYIVLPLASLASSAATGCSLQTANDDEETAVIEAAYRTSLGGVSCAGEDDNAVGAREAVSRLRAMAGLSPLQCDRAASAASLNHCEYIASFGELTHVEEKGRPSFTGVNFWERMTAAGFAGEATGEVLSTLTGSRAIEHPRGLVNSVYHRAPFLRSESTVFGYGHTDNCAAIEFGRPVNFKVPTSRVIWPPDGSSSVPTSFYAHRETPNPVPGRTIVGSPITLVTNQKWNKVSFAVKGPDGKKIDGDLLIDKNDPAHLVRAGEAHFVPYEPFAPNTKYTGTFTVEGVSDSGDYKMSTTFTTGGT